MDNATPFECPSPEMLARLFPAYEIEEFIEAGGMGMVYRARHISLDRRVALKILPRQIGEQPDFRQSFLTEARAMARLSHPNLISAYDVGEVEGLLYIAMEYVDGNSLFYSSHGRSIDPEQAVAIILKIAEGLAHAHAAGIVHRDVKPANILLNRDAVPKLGDFGLAVRSGSDSGLCMGTPGYLAPEVMANPQAADARCDIFALGVILYELLTGALPNGDSKPPSASAQVNAAMDRICAKAMHPDPELRYQDMNAMIGDLIQWKASAARLKVDPEAKRSGHKAAAAPGAINQQRFEEKKLRKAMILKVAIIAILVCAIWMVLKEKKRREGVLTQNALPVPAETAGPQPKENKETAGVFVEDPFKAAEASKNNASASGIPASGSATVPQPTVSQDPSRDANDVQSAGSPVSPEPAVPVLQASAPNKYNKDSPFINTLGMKFVSVPDTRVLFSIWETRVRDYAEFSGKRNPSVVWKTKNGGKVVVPQNDNDPIVFVNRKSANSYCNWLTAKEAKSGTIPNGARYRLPTDLEWSAAAGLGMEQGSTPRQRSDWGAIGYPWSGEFPPKSAVGNYCDATFAREVPTEPMTPIANYNDGYATTAPVGSFPPNAYGIYDLGGNVGEWCADDYDLGNKRCVIRGSSFVGTDPDQLRTSFRRGWKWENTSWVWLGFRCVLDLSGVPEDAVLALGKQPPRISAVPDSQNPPLAATGIPIESDNPKLGNNEERKTPAGVPSDAKPRGNKWYRVYDEKCPWSSARSKCNALGGQLAVIPDEATNRFIKDLARGRTLWLGATDEIQEGIWKWVDGTGMNYRNFGRGFPDNWEGHEDWLVMNWKTAEGEWNDGGSKHVFGYICEWPDKHVDIDTDNPLAKTPGQQHEGNDLQTVMRKAPSGVPSDAKYQNGKWYRVCMAKCSWKTARDACRKDGGQLAMIPDEATNSFIKGLAGGRVLWLGATDEAREGKWLWENGTEMTFKAFAPRQPDNAKGNENHLMMWPGGKWNDAADEWDKVLAFKPTGYICEWPGNPGDPVAGAASQTAPGNQTADIVGTWKYSGDVQLEFRADGTILRNAKPAGKWTQRDKKDEYLIVLNDRSEHIGTLDKYKRNLATADRVRGAKKTTMERIDNGSTVNPNVPDSAAARRLESDDLKTQIESMEGQLLEVKKEAAEYWRKHYEAEALGRPNSWKMYAQNADRRVLGIERNIAESRKRLTGMRSGS